ncbi:MAG: family 10 glycosylhydrolase [Candidatus Omnitrophica bacterium]|nr:family 10 glycosylhydrolase [Candidatus Omnitrophota bacterium]
MKTQALFFILCFVLLFPGAAKSEDSASRGLFIATIGQTPVLSSRQQIAKAVDFARENRIKTIFVQVYRANQSWFPSKVADSSPYKECFKSLSEDPLALLIKEAHASGVQVHAWLNLLSLSTNKNARILKKFGPGILTRNIKEKKTIGDYRIDDQYFLEPGDLNVRKELTRLVEEILTAYPGLDGILFDYIRYPDSNPAYGHTEVNIARFKEATGIRKISEDSPAWKNWKRGQVTELLKRLVDKTRGLRPGIQVSATGCAPFSRSYYEAFQDWPSWLQSGLIDYVTIMSYPIDISEFEKDISQAKNKAVDFRKVNIAVGAYKMLASPETFARQYNICENTGCNSCVIFHYDSLLRNPALANCLTAGSKEPARQQARNTLLKPDVITR